MSQNERLDSLNPGVDRIWGTFKTGEVGLESDRLDHQTSLASRAIVESGEYETKRVNQARGIVTYGPGEPTAIAFNHNSTDVISFNQGVGPNNHKYISSQIGTYIAQTESGNQYIIHPAEGLVISARGDVWTDVYNLPDMEFGKPWELENGLKTTPIRQLLSEYKVGEVAGDFHKDHPSPFIWANQVIDQVVEQISK